MRFFDARGLLLGLAFVAVFLAFVGVKSLYTEWWPSYKTNSAIARVLDCATEKNAVACTRPEVKKLLNLMSGADLMDVLSKRSQPMWCHYTGHVVGQEIFKEYQDVEMAISQCSRSCDSACLHGIIGQAFAEEIGVDYENLDLLHLSPDEIKVVGKRLCQTIGTCHGVGHALFQIYQKFEPAFGICREIAGPLLNQCYNGVTMEYADILSSRSMTSPPDVKNPTRDALPSLCNFPTLQEARACFRYFPRMVYATLRKQDVSEGDSLKFVINVCESYKETKLRIACFSGIGSNGSYLVLTDTGAAVRSCEGLGSEQAEAACIVGKLGVATEDRMKPLASYCAAMSNEKMKAVCYQGLFFFLDRVGIPLEPIQGLCKKEDGICLQGLRDYKIDPVEQIKNFSR